MYPKCRSPQLSLVRKALLTSLLILVAGNFTAWADQEEAARRFAQGQTLLAQGDLRAALEAFSAAAKADPENAEYRQEAVILRRVLDLRKQLSTDENLESWQQRAKALFAYYRSRDARIEESRDAGGGDFYARVYEADRRPCWPRPAWPSTRTRRPPLCWPLSPPIKPPCPHACCMAWR